MNEEMHLTDAMTEADLARASEALALLVETPGWTIVSDLLDRQRIQAGLAIVEGHDDRPIEFWRGYVAHINGLKADLNTLVEAGRELRAQAQREEANRELSAMGQGPLSE